MLCEREGIKEKGREDLLYISCLLLANAVDKELDKEKSLKIVEQKSGSRTQTKVRG